MSYMKLMRMIFLNYFFFAIKLFGFILKCSQINIPASISMSFIGLYFYYLESYLIFFMVTIMDTTITVNISASMLGVV